MPDSFNTAIATSLVKKSSLQMQMEAKQVSNQVNDHHLDNPRQSQDKAGHSIETALLSIKIEMVQC